jgi:hypothetical protein
MATRQASDFDIKKKAPQKIIENLDPQRKLPLLLP